jgi:hypothetical protein
MAEILTEELEHFVTRISLLGNSYSCNDDTKYNSMEHSIAWKLMTV